MIQPIFEIFNGLVSRGFGDLNKHQGVEFSRDQEIRKN